MARIVLWLMVILGFISMLIKTFNGYSVDTSMFNRIVIYSALSVLALCETITELGKTLGNKKGDNKDA